VRTKNIITTALKTYTYNNIEIKNLSLNNQTIFSFIINNVILNSILEDNIKNILIKMLNSYSNIVNEIRLLINNRIIYTDSSIYTYSNILNTNTINNNRILIDTLTDITLINYLKYYFINFNNHQNQIYIINILIIIKKNSIEIKRKFSKLFI